MTQRFGPVTFIKVKDSWLQQVIKAKPVRSVLSSIKVT